MVKTIEPAASWPAETPGYHEPERMNGSWHPPASLARYLNAGAFTLAGHLLRETGQRDAAVRRWRRAAAIFTELGDPRASELVQLIGT